MRGRLRRRPHLQPPVSVSQIGAGAATPIRGVTFGMAKPPRDETHRRLRSLTARLAILLLLLLPMPALGREYRLELSSDCRWKLDVDDAVQTALTAMTRPIAELQVRSLGGVEVRPR